jgi:GntR family transcriptional regulator
MGPDTVSHRSYLPVYAQIQRQLEADLDERRFHPGERLPAEDELAARFGASRMTVRRAVDQLVRQGRLERLAGKGTFVLPQFPNQPQPTVLQWDFRRDPLPPGLEFRLADVQLAQPDLQSARRLHTILDEAVVRLTLYLYGAWAPLGYFQVQLPQALVADVTEWDLQGGSVASFLTTRHGLRFGRVVEQVRAAAASPEVAEFLMVDPGSPVLAVESLIHLAAGVPALWSEARFRGGEARHTGQFLPPARA